MSDSISNERALRRALETAQAEVKRLTKALERDRGPEALKRQALERRAEQLEQSRRELDESWRERERHWQHRERALRDQLDVITEKLARAEKALRSRPQRPPGKLATVVRGLLSPSKLKRELDEARGEIARLNQQLTRALMRPRQRG